MYDRILVPTDGSQGTAHVALQAIDLAEQYGATVHALYVVDDSVRSVFPEVGGSGSLEEAGNRAIDRITKMASVHGVEAVGKLREGDPADEILTDADVTDAERQQHVWVVDADAGDERLVVYLDPVTQRTSIVSHA